MDCEFCHKQFTKGILARHQQTTKACLKLQGESMSKTFTCDGCYNILCSKYRLRTHQQKCEKF